MKTTLGFWFLFVLNLSFVSVGEVEAEKCVDDATCFSWKQNKMCESRGISEEKKKAVCPITCGFCKAVDNQPAKSTSKEVSSDLFQNTIDKSVNPCDDFYKYSCGRYIASNPAKNGDSHSTFIDLSRRVDEQEMVAVFANGSSRSKAVTMMRHFRDKCMNIALLEKEKTKTLLEQIKDIGGIPMMDSAWTDANFKLDEWLPKMTNYTGMNFLFDVELSPKERGAQRLFFSASNLILKKAEMYVEPEYSQQLAALNAFVVEFMGTIGADLASTSTYETVKTAVDNALKLEAQIAQILIDEQVTDEQTLETTMSNPKTIDELKALGANLDWTKYLTDHPMLQDAEVKAYVQANPPIFIHTPEAIKQTLAAIDAKKKEAADYLMIRFILQQIPYLDERFSDSAYRFAWKLTGFNPKAPRKVECFELIKRNFPLVVDYLYVEKFLNKKVLGKATELIDKLRQGLAVMLRSEENWMDPSNRAYAIQKLGNMKEIVGAVPSARDPKELDKKYENVVFGKNDKYTAMAAKIKLIEEARTYQSLIRAGGEYDKSTRADNTNPSHIYENNQIFIPAAVLEKSFVDFDLPSSLVYGSLGFIIGHELTHAFDAKGSEFDASGLRRKWWSETTNTEYEDRSQCLIDAYEQEEEPQTQKPVDGQLTQNENIADAGGLRAAFTSFNLNTERKDGPIAGFDDLNANQQFFVRFAINHCANLDRSYQEHLMETDPHTFSAARVNVVLRNYPEFAKAFQCPSGSPMNPEEQCSLW